MILGQKNRLLSRQTQRWPGILIAAFLACFFACAVVMQVISDIHPKMSSAPIEFFTAVLLFMSSMVCLLIASESSFIDQRVIFWVLGSVALAFLGIDERFSFHERTEGFLINDDHIKLVLWVICSGALLQICRMETKDRNVILLFCLGYFFHAMYLVVQLGDGDYFRLPYFSKSVLRWMEEMFELTMLTLYFSALLSIYTGRRRVVH